MSRAVLVAAFLLVASAHADTWIPLKVINGYSYEVDPITKQIGSKTDSSKTPITGIWVRADAEHPTQQVWVDCNARMYQSFVGIWMPWKPIPPESMEWAVWEYLCVNPPKKQSPKKESPAG